MIEHCSPPFDPTRARALVEYSWLPHVRASVEEQERRFGVVATTYAGHDPAENRAADFWSYDKAQHDRMLAWLQANATRLSVMYVITWERIWSVARAAEGIRRYHLDWNRDGIYSDSERHVNHLHVSYLADPNEPDSGGFPMAAPESLDIPTYSAVQDLTPRETGRVRINDQAHVSVVTGSATAIDARAAIEVDRLYPGEYVNVWWRKEWKKTGEDDLNKGGDVQASIVPSVGLLKPAAHISYAGDLPAADSGWTACLRLMYYTNSTTARIRRVQIRGWVIK